MVVIYFFALLFTLAMATADVSLAKHWTDWDPVTCDGTTGLQRSRRRLGGHVLWEGYGTPDLQDLALLLLGSICVCCCRVVGVVESLLTSCRSSCTCETSRD